MRVGIAMMGSALLFAAACASGHRWVNELPESKGAGREDGWTTADPEAATPAPAATASGHAIEIADIAGTPRAVVRDEASELYRNTYYDFPRDRGGDKSATIYDAKCAPIAKVSQKFHDQVCVQGSGRLASGETVSFAKRGCACAAVCPRTSQKICFERLDPRSFPHGRGAAGRPITPLRTVAVDPAIIPLGTAIFIPELAGLPLPDGGTHDGCFWAEDKGIKVVGRHVDVFTGDPAVTAQWNDLVPSNKGVHVRIGDTRCARY